MSLPNIAVSVITYNRAKEFARVMESIFDNLKYPKEKVTLIIADDKSDTDYISGWEGFYQDTILIRQTERSGMGKQWNDAIKEASKHGTFTIPVMDDWLWVEPVDIKLAIRFMQCNPEYGAVRYHKLAGHVGLPAVIKQWDTRGYVNGYVDSYNDYEPALMTFLELMPPYDDSNTYSPYSGGVHIRHNAFTDFYGEYIEGLKFSLSEMNYFERVNRALRENLNVCPRFAMFPHYIQARFKDISPASYRDTIVESETLK